jgi:hypothetical protein
MEPGPFYFRLNYHSTGDVWQGGKSSTTEGPEIKKVWSFTPRTEKKKAGYCLRLS